MRKAVIVLISMLLMTAYTFAQEYNQTDSSQNYFFPIDNAQKKGYEITTADWALMTDEQKNQYAKEAIEETSREESSFVGLNDTSELLEEVDKNAGIYNNLGEEYVMPVFVLFLEFFKNKGLMKRPDTSEMKKLLLK